AAATPAAASARPTTTNRVAFFNIPLLLLGSSVSTRYAEPRIARPLVAAATAAPAGRDRVPGSVEGIPRAAEAVDSLTVRLAGPRVARVLVHEPPVVRAIGLAVAELLRAEQRGVDPHLARGARAPVGAP